MKKLISILFFSLFNWVAFSQYTEQNLSSGKWWFSEYDENSTGKNYPATIPGTVHTDLYHNQLISDPYYSSNEKELQWIEEKDWKYSTDFYLSKQQYKQKHIELVFEGLDTYAEVFLNDKLILKADNMFRTWPIDIKPFAKKGQNHLTVLFHSAVKEAKKRSKELSYTLPGEDRVFTRKAQYHFGWDWGPRFVTCGIWKEVKLRFWNDLKIENIQVVQKKLDLQNAEISVVTQTSPYQSGNYAIKYAVYFQDSLIHTAQKKITSSFTTTDCSIANPQLWWSNGLGKPHLYQLKVELLKDGKSIQTKVENIGLRTIELVQEKDSLGASFHFKLNGVPVFCKGANVIPLDFFTPQATEKSYQTLIQNALETNMNMLRVWGGGIYENDKFYELCDANGIMVWQDFMFACAMYPGDERFLNTVSEEVSQQITRLRNHPSVVLWCGNNENSEGWHNWGWQKQYGYTAQDSTEIIHNYQKLFHALIPDKLAALDSGRPYHPSSPATGWGRKESLLQGDLHYWGVWWGQEPFSAYENKVGRFVSEYGTQGMPSLESFKNFIPNDELHLESNSVKSHQKHPTGYATIEHYIRQHYKVPTNFEDYIYVSQLTQALGMTKAINAHRKAMPYCMGSLYWQFNDCWPVTSWSGIDYYNNPKALHYAVQKTFNNVVIIPERKEDKVHIFVVSDLLEELEAKLLLTEYNFHGTIIFSEEVPLVIAPNQSLKYHSYKYQSDLNVLKLSLAKEGKTLFETYYYFKEPKDLVLEKPRLSIEMLDSGSIKISCEDYLAKDVFLQYPGVRFSDNFFDLLPGESRIIKYEGNIQNPKEINIKTLFNTL